MTLFYKIPPHLPLPKGGKLPLFGKWFGEAHHPELVEGEGPPVCVPRTGQGRFCGACQFNFETLNNSVNIAMGYRTMTILSPKEVGDEEENI